MSISFSLFSDRISLVTDSCLLYFFYQQSLQAGPCYLVRRQVEEVLVVKVVQEKGDCKGIAIYFLKLRVYT
jgi:hypothetical protein